MTSDCRIICCRATFCKTICNRCTMQAYKQPQTNNIGFEKITQFADSVSSFSSQYGSESSISYVVDNIKGPPSIYPTYGDFTHCCVLRTYGPWWNWSPANINLKPYQRTPIEFISHDFIELLYEEAVYPASINIYETYNPGAVVRILCCCNQSDGPDKWFELYSGQPVRAPASCRIFSPELKKCLFPTKLIRLEINQTLCEYYTEIDAVELIGTKLQDNDIDLLSIDQCLCHADENDEGSSVDPIHYCDIQVICDSAICSYTHGQEENCCANDTFTNHLASLNMDNALDGMSAASELKNGYFYYLPEEVIQIIISFLDLPALCIMSTVSRLFHKHCYDTLQYQDLNLQPYWHKVTDNALLGFISRCEMVQRVNLAWCSITGKSLQEFIPSCGRNLTALSLANSQLITSLDILLITKHCTRLQDLDLSCCRKVDNTGFTPLYRLGELHRLNLYRTMVDAYSLIFIVKSCVQLEYLNLGSCIRITDFGPLINELASHCKKLKALDLWRARHFLPENLRLLADNCPHLEELDLGWCFELASQSGCFVHLAEKCRGLKKLYVTANRTICDRDINALANYCKDLEQLDILGTREVTLTTTQRLLDQCQKMKLLDVSFCHFLDNLTVAQLRRQYPNVAIKRSFQT